MYEFSQSRSITNFLNKTLPPKVVAPVSKYESISNGLFSGKSTPSLVKSKNLGKSYPSSVKKTLNKPLGNLKNEGNFQLDQPQTSSISNNDTIETDEQKNMSKNLPAKYALMELRPRPSRAVIQINKSLISGHGSLTSCVIKTNELSISEVSDLAQIISKAANNLVYIYKCETKPNDKVDKSVLEALDNLSLFAGDPNMKSKFAYDDLSMIFEMLSLHVFHSFPDISKTYIIGESVSPYYMNNWNQLSRVYALLSLLLPELLPFITDTVFEKFTKLLSSPFNSEQEAVLSFIEKVCQKSEEHESKVFMMMTRVVQLFIDGECLHFCLIPIFNFLKNFLEKLPLPLDRSYFEIFRSIFYQTIISPNVVDFYNALVPLAQFFQSKDSTTSIWCIRFLFRHWPVTNSEKQIIFLHQLQFILSMLNASYFTTLSKALISHLKMMIESVNFKVAMAAIKILKDEEFVKLICSSSSNTPNSASASDILIPALTQAQSHWNNDVRMSSIEALNLIKTNSKGKAGRSSRNAVYNPPKNPIKPTMSYQEHFQNKFQMRLKSEQEKRTTTSGGNGSPFNMKKKYGSYAQMPSSCQTSSALSFLDLKNDEKFSASSSNLTSKESSNFPPNQQNNQEKRISYKPLNETQKQWNFILKMASRRDKEIDQYIYKSIIRTLDE